MSYMGKKNARPILIKFHNHSHRDEVFSNRFNLKKSEGQALYLNENLPPHLRMLRGKANMMRKNKGYKFLWMKYGNIFVRKNEGSTVISIKKMSDLEKIV